MGNGNGLYLPCYLVALRDDGIHKHNPIIEHKRGKETYVCLETNATTLIGEINHRLSYDSLSNMRISDVKHFARQMHLPPSTELVFFHVLDESKTPATLAKTPLVLDRMVDVKRASGRFPKNIVQYAISAPEISPDDLKIPVEILFQKTF